MPFHRDGYIIIDGIVARRQLQGAAIAEGYVPRRVGYLRLKRKAGALRQDQLPPRERGEYAALGIAGRPCRPPGARSSSGPLWAGGSLGSLGSGDSLRAYLPPFTGTARRPRLSPGTHGPGLPPFITNAGHPRHFPWFHRTGSAAAGRIVPFRLRSPRIPETIWRGALRPAAFLRRRLARPLIQIPVRAPLPEQIRRIALPVPVIVIQLKTPHSYLIFNHGACDMIHYMHGRSICFSSQALIGPGLCTVCRMPLPSPRSSRRPWRCFRCISASAPYSIDVP